MSDEMVYLEVAEQPQPSESAEQAELANSILTTGIVGLALACTGVAAIAGIFVSKNALNKAEEYAQRYGKRTGKALVGGHLARGGFYGSIGMTVFFAFFFVFYFAVIFGILMNV